MNQPRSREFYRRDSKSLARALLGQRLVHVINGRRLAGLIVETEAYLGRKDQAAHSYNGRRTRRNESMWCDGGVAYVYFIYGMHYCFNVVAGKTNDPIAVLIRALEPVEGLDSMYRRRSTARKVTDLCSGPSKLCQSMGIDHKLDGRDLTQSKALFIEMQRPHPSARIRATRRVGIDYAGSWATKPLRYYLRNNPNVSRR